MNLHVSVMHAPWSDRAPYVEAIAQACSHPAVSSLRIVEDTHRQGVWMTAKRAWAAGMRTEASHVVVLQDDAILCDNFVDNLLKAISYRPSHIISLFSMQRRSISEARKLGIHWAWGPDAAYSIGMLMPKEEVRRFLVWERENIDPSNPHDDTRIGLYARLTKQGVWVTCPNLIEHGEPRKSLLGHGNRERIALWFDKDPSWVDWSEGVDSPVRISATCNTKKALKIREGS